MTDGPVATRPTVRGLDSSTGTEIGTTKYTVVVERGRLVVPKSGTSKECRPGGEVETTTRAPSPEWSGVSVLGGRPEG